MGTFDSTDELLVKNHKGFAVITLNVPHKKNALDARMYGRLAELLRTLDRQQDVFATILTGTGDFFSAGADIKQDRSGDDNEISVRTAQLKRLAGSNMDLAAAMYTHSKILIAALNGPAVGLSAALLGHCDFIYSVENAWIATPFSTLSLVAEGAASATFPRRMGISMANEALIMGKKLGAPALQANGFFNRLFPASDFKTFIGAVLEYLEDKFSGLDMQAAIRTKQLIRESLPGVEAANIKEILAGSEQLAGGKPQEAFARIANKTMRHKL